MKILKANTFILLGLCSATLGAFAQGTAFTYQGRLAENGNAANGTYEFRFALFDAVSGGIQIGSPATSSAVAVSSGNFTVTIDFGASAFPGANRWLQIGVRTNGSGGAFTTLNPRQPVTATPYALTAGDVTGANIARLNPPNTAVQATGTPVITSGFITSANVVNGGSGYVTPPLVTVNDTTGSGAIILANLSGGSVASFTVQNPGSGYSAGATLTVGAPPANSSQTFASANYFSGVNTMTNANNTFAGSFAGTFNGSGAGLTSLNAAQLTGSIADGRLSGNVALRNASQTFGGANDFTGANTLNNPNNSFAGNFSGSFSGNGTGLSNVAGMLAWQTVAGTNQQAAPNVGYIVTNSLPTTITLPVAPAVGSRVRVVSAGNGGWKIAQNNGQLILVGVSATPASGLVWVQRATSNMWISVASSADGTKLVAAADGGQIYVSTNAGVAWAARETDRNWADVASSADGTKLVAADYAGKIYTSTDSGAAWTPRDSDRAWASVASSDDGTYLVAVTQNFDIGMGLEVGDIFTSVNSGVTWTRRNLPQNWREVASSADGRRLAATLSDDGLIFTSSNAGTNWTQQFQQMEGAGFVASSADGLKLAFASLGGHIFTSTNAGAFIIERDEVRNWISIASSADGTRLLASVALAGQLYISTDSGFTWTPRETGRNWGHVASSADGTRLVATVYGGYIYTSSASADTGTMTTTGATGFISGGLGAAIELLYIGNNRFVPVSFIPAIQAN